MIPWQNRIPFIRMAGEPRICAPFTFITWKRPLYSDDPLSWSKKKKKEEFYRVPFPMNDRDPRIADGDVTRTDVSVLDSSISPGSQRNENSKKNRSDATKISFFSLTFLPSTTKLYKYCYCIKNFTRLFQIIERFRFCWNHVIIVTR